VSERVPIEEERAAFETLPASVNQRQDTETETSDRESTCSGKEDPPELSHDAGLTRRHVSEGLVVSQPVVGASNIQETVRRHSNWQ